MAQFSSQHPSAGSPRPVLGAFADLTSGDALAQADRVAAETLIRTTVQVLGNGSTVNDLDSLVQRNAGRVSQSDVRAGRLGSNVLGDIISTVEQAKGSSGAFNWHSAPPDQIKAYLVANGIDPTQAQRLISANAERQAAARDDGGARYDGMANFKGDWSSPAGLDYMRGYAVKHGLAWATNNPELLRLGPSAIDALVAANLKQETYQRLTDEKVGFKAKDVVTLSKFAKEKNVDSNALGGVIADVNTHLSPQLRQEHNKALMGYMGAKPEQVEAADARLRAVQDEIVRTNPSLAPTIKQEQKLLKMKGTEATTQHNAVVDRASAGAEKGADNRTNASAEAMFGGGATPPASPAAAPSGAAKAGGEAKAKPKLASGGAAP